MLSKFIRSSPQLANQTMRCMQVTTTKNATLSAAVTSVPIRSFSLTKYAFDDEDWKPNQFQVSIKR